MKVEYSPESVSDLVRLREFIEIKNPLAAKRIASELVNGIEKLKIFPSMGIPVSRAPEPDQIRDIFVSDYTIRYLVGSGAIYILRVWHNKENEKNV